MSQSKKKKQPKNAFYFFMVDYKNQQEKRGIKFSGGMKDVAEKAAPIWKSMGAGERWIYEEEARKEKERDKTDLENKFTTQGKSYAQLEREMLEIREQELKMVQEIEGTVRSLDTESLVRYPFYIIHVNYYCRQENGNYTPCEIALAEFNFMDGIKNTYHTLINPGQIPLGYKFEADKLSAESHQIPVPPEDFGGENDYYKIFTNVKRFVTGVKGKDVHPYYTQPNCIDAVKNILGRLQEDFSEKIEFRVYPLTKLFFELRNASAYGGKGFPAFSLAERELDRDVFNFARGIACDFHEETDAIPYCSLSCVKRWSFLIMDHCCKDLDVDLIPGQHCPRQADTKKKFQKMTSRSASVDDDAASSCSRMSLGGKSTAFPANSKLGVNVKAGNLDVKEKHEALKPLRLPKTQPEAFRVMGLSDEDFPAIGASSSHKPTGVQGGDSFNVTGRGRSARLANPIGIGRGRALAANLGVDFSQLNLK